MTTAPPTALFREIGDLKRVRVAHADGSVATRSFVRAWARLVDGADADEVALAECAAAVAGARLAGLDADVLLRVGLTPAETGDVLARAVREVGAPLAPPTVERLLAALPARPASWTHLAVPERDDAATGLPAADRYRARVPAFVAALARQPRAGATAPGRPREIVEPPENHAEHCWAVAVYGGLLVLEEGGEPGDAFLLGLAHHLHNVTLPDAGFAGEMLLGEHLGPVVDRLERDVLAQLPGPLATRVAGLLALRADAGTPVGRAFHAADVLDRVLQCHHHARAASFTVERATVDLELVHASPVSGYHHAVLVAAGLAPAPARTVAGPA